MGADHTPGPWTVDSAGTPPHHWYVRGPAEEPYEDGYLNEADARLIAAAPDLLAALEASWPGIVGDDNAYDRPIQEVHEQVSAAIAKAKGEV